MLNVFPQEMLIESLNVMSSSFFFLPLEGELGKLGGVKKHTVNREQRLKTFLLFSSSKTEKSTDNLHLPMRHYISQLIPESNPWTTGVRVQENLFMGFFFFVQFSLNILTSINASSLMHAALKMLMAPRYNTKYWAGVAVDTMRQALRPPKVNAAGTLLSALYLAFPYYFAVCAL